MVHGYNMLSTKLLGYGLLLGLLLASSSDLRAQAVPEFAVDVVSVRGNASAAQTRLDIYTQIPYNNLNFISTATGFTASYEVVAQIFQLDDRNHREALVQTPIWDHSVVVASFGLTQSNNQFDYTTHSLSLPPGPYLIEFQVTDENSQEAFVRELPVWVRDLSGSLALSDLILVQDYDEAKQTIFPHVGSQIGANETSFDVFYEIYADQPRQIRVTREVVPMRKDDGRLIKSLLGIRDKTADPTVLYSDSEVTSLSRGRHQIVSTIPLNELEVGDYLARVRLEDEAGTLLAEAEHAFSAQWTGLAAHLNDLDEAIEQLNYIGKTREIQPIKDATTREERLRRFEAFWSKRDPTPGTRRNERMEEYYYRIDYANRKYGSVTPGWKTDRGHVLILFGYPDHIERSTFSFDAEPWEIWSYYRIGRQLYFVDKTGFGDYELVVPIYDERNRIR